MKNTPVTRTTNINSEQTLEWIRAHPADMLVVFGGRILGPDVIGQFPSGILNLHLGLSPDYKGGHCIEWPIYHGRPKMVGATVHYIDEGIDSGNLIAQFRTDPRPGENLASVMTRTYKGGIELLVDVFDRIRKGDKMKSVPQEKKGFCYYEKHFTPEIGNRAWRIPKPKSELRKRIEAKLSRDSFQVLGKVGFCRKLFPHLPYPSILLYHEVGDAESPYLRHCGLEVSTERFKKHVEVLGEFYEVLSVDRIRDACKEGERLTDTIAFSFDDGYRGILDAFSILKECGYPATAYINSDFACHREVFWRSKLSYLVVKNHGDKLCSVSRDAFGDEFDTNESGIFDWIKSRIDDPRMEKIVSAAFSDYGDEAGRNIYAGWDELRGLDGNLFTFGNHTQTHLCMASLPPEQQEKQIAAGRRGIIENLGNCGAGFSIPFGERNHYNEHT